MLFFIILSTLTFQFIALFKKLGESIFDSLITSLIAQLVKNPLVMWEALVRFLGWEDLLQKAHATHSSILGLPLWLRW